MLLLLVSRSSQSQVADDARWLASSISCPFSVDSVAAFGGGRCVAGVAVCLSIDGSPVSVLVGARRACMLDAAPCHMSVDAHLRGPVIGRCSRALR